VRSIDRFLGRETLRSQVSTLGTHDSCAVSLAEAAFRQLPPSIVPWKNIGGMFLCVFADHSEIQDSDQPLWLLRFSACSKRCDISRHPHPPRTAYYSPKPSSFLLFPMPFEGDDRILETYRELCQQLTITNYNATSVTWRSDIQRGRMKGGTPIMGVLPWDICVLSRNTIILPLHMREELEPEQWRPLSLRLSSTRKRFEPESSLE
jgi:hypothetical protein